MSKKLENVTQLMYDIYSTVEDLYMDLTNTSGKSLKKSNESLVGMLTAVSNLLNMSNANADSEKDALQKINERVGKAYGVYIKMLKMTSEESTKDHKYISKSLKGLSDDFKKLLSDLNALHQNK